jgi:hypothetical protein
MSEFSKYLKAYLSLSHLTNVGQHRRFSQDEIGTLRNIRNELLHLLVDKGFWRFGTGGGVTYDKSADLKNLYPELPDTFDGNSDVKVSPPSIDEIYRRKE